MSFTGKAQPRERAVKMVLDHADVYRSVYAACQTIDPKVGDWCGVAAEVDVAGLVGCPSGDRMLLGAMAVRSSTRLATRTVHRQIRSSAEADNTGMDREHVTPLGRHRLVLSLGEGISA
jgi:hypothetical protein